MSNGLKLACVVALLALITVLVFALRPSPAPSRARQDDGAPHLYVTWDRFEVDRCVAAWLIKRRLDPLARFELLPVESPPPSEGCVSFDVPGAKYERQPGTSVSEAVLAEINVEDPALDWLIRLVRAVEVAFWMLEPDSEEAKLRGALLARWEQAPDTDQRFQAIFEYLDEVHAAAEVIE